MRFVIEARSAAVTLEDLDGISAGRCVSDGTSAATDKLLVSLRTIDNCLVSHGEDTSLQGSLRCFRREGRGAPRARGNSGHGLMEAFS